MDRRLVSELADCPWNEAGRDEVDWTWCCNCDRCWNDEDRDDSGRICGCCNWTERDTVELLEAAECGTTTKQKK